MTSKIGKLPEPVVTRPASAPCHVQRSPVRGRSCRRAPDRPRSVPDGSSGGRPPHPGGPAGCRTPHLHAAGVRAAAGAGEGLPGGNRTGEADLRLPREACREPRPSPRRAHPTVGAKGSGVDEHDFDVGEYGAEIGTKVEPATREELQKLLEASPGFKALPKNQQAALQLFLELPSTEDGTRFDLTQTLQGPDWKSLSKPEQRKALTAVLEAQRPEVQDPLTQGPPESRVQISKPTREGEFDSFEVTVKGRTIPVRMPKMDPPSTSQNGSVYGERSNHTVDEVARALSQLPPETLSVITSVELSATRNPSDEYWAQQYNMPDFTAYMTCGAEGLVTIYPQAYPLGTEDIAETLIHEAGHAWSFQQWGDDPAGKAWGPWRAAPEKDGISVSNYATHSPTEDVSETSAVYLATGGTPEHERFRQAFPARFAVLDQVFAGMKAAG